jgi:hypothetical protein
MISKNVVWESNGLVKRNPNIERENIVPKSSTSDFPCGKVTVRYHNQRSKLVTAYFQGPMKTRTWGSGANASTHSYPDGVLRVTLPYSSSGRRYGNSSSNFQFQGELPDNYKLEDMAEVLNYIKEKVEEMS